ncbi:hypothetical protein [Mycolicibacterium mucogenicum]|uniref:Uncharacterized protein n=1 Tax=Mycolicibacterium mucogenicum DSM 44124 TaxID=1226753 RepID=A0A8H2PFB2_MYCMU|nr:hypothetical protein [Mycolicibacterium mucogenicum]KAB7761183.1 hypothetical protein MMUC44124_00880 [Mycolicibacterium mucogenicum DSM 44124]QPG69989.1 hypothetical protein C1S78_002875 [Mycolicibacterium mucogenicum DSM 44124]
MPAGVEVVVDEGFATIDFVDATLRGPGLAKLLEIGGPETIEPLTREKGAERKLYRVPEGNAREAGLLDAFDGPDVDEGTGVENHGTELPADGQLHDVSLPGVEPETPLAQVEQEFPEGEPSEDWHLAELKAYANSKGIDAHELRTKAKVLALINGQGDNPA